MANKQVSSEVLQELTNKVQDIINNYCWNLEHFSDDEVNSFFQASADEVTYYNSLINDKIESKNFIWSSKNISEKIAQAIIQANEYADELIKDISSIKLKYVTSLPTSDISEHTIYILKASDGTSKDTLNLYNATDGWTSIGDFNISLDDYYTKTETDTKLDLKANKTEVIENDKINQTLDSTTNSADTVLSTNGLQTELDKKINKNTFIKLNDLPNGSYCKIDSFIQNNNEFITLDIVKSDGTINRLELTNAGNVINHINYDGTNWTKVGSVCTTNVADVKTTTIEPTFPSTITLGKMQTIYYSVKNGWANVSIIMNLNASPELTWTSIATGLPKPDKEINSSSFGETAVNNASVGFRLGIDGILEMLVGSEITKSDWWNINFSYPVAES